MYRIKTLFARIKTMSFKRMFYYAGLASRESGRFKLFILIDMVLCALKYGVGYLDYHTFGFAHITKAADRATYMTMNDNIRLINSINDQTKRELFENKLLFDRNFTEFLGRKYASIQECTEEEFCAFADGEDRVFVKTLDGYGGLGVSAVEIPDSKEDAVNAFNTIKKAGYGLAEEAIRQHPEMNSICAKSVNTIRMVTLIDKAGETHLMYALVRFGMGTADVDNISSGGMYSRVSMEGVITSPSFCDKTGELYSVHPVSGTQIVGFRIPYFDEAKEMVLKASKVIPEVRYVGWDVAISESGPVLVEGNTIPSYDMCQNYRHLPEGEKTGILPKFRKILDGEF